MIDAIPQISQNEANISQLSEMANKCESLAFEIETLFLTDATTDSRPASSPSGPSGRDLTPYLEAYERIYLDMFEMANKLDKMLLWGKCFFLMSNNTRYDYQEDSYDSDGMPKYPDIEKNIPTFGDLADLEYYLSAHEIK